MFYLIAKFYIIYCIKATTATKETIIWNFYIVRENIFYIFYFKYAYLKNKYIKKHLVNLFPLINKQKN